jgi:hypothetical protein
MDTVGLVEEKALGGYHTVIERIDRARVSS